MVQAWQYAPSPDQGWAVLRRRLMEESCRCWQRKVASVGRPLPWPVASSADQCNSTHPEDGGTAHHLHPVAPVQLPDQWLRLARTRSGLRLVPAAPRNANSADLVAPADKPAVSRRIPDSAGPSERPG